MDTNTRVNSSATGGVFNAVYTDKKKEGVQVEDFLNLMVQQLANQDFMNPVDDAQYLSQLAQFATMQQMQELGQYSKSNYAMSLIGKDVTVASIGVGGKVNSVTAPVEKISLVDGEYNIYVKGKVYTLEQIMQVHTPTDDDTTVDTSGKTIEVDDITKNSASFSWPAASTADGSKDKVKYTVYYSTSKDFDSVEDVEANGTVLGAKNRTELTSESVKGLDPNTTYYVNVVVTDENNNKTVYSKGAFKTLEE